MILVARLRFQFLEFGTLHIPLEASNSKVCNLSLFHIPTPLFFQEMETLEIFASDWNGPG